MNDAFVLVDSEGAIVSVTVTNRGDLIFSPQEIPFRITRNQLDDLLDWVGES